MALNSLRPRLRNISNGVAKVQINIPAGDEIEVSEEVAAQIAHQGAPLRAESDAPEAPAAEPVSPAPIKAKRAAKKAPARKG